MRARGEYDENGDENDPHDQHPNLSRALDETETRKFVHSPALPLHVRGPTTSEWLHAIA